MTSGTTNDTADIAADVVLTALRGTVAAIRSEQRKQVQWVAAWGDAHSEDRLRGGLVPDLESEHHAMRVSEREVFDGMEEFIESGGPGSPMISEFCTAELGAALGTTTQSAALLLGDVMELKHRLPKTYKKLIDGEVGLWLARELAKKTRRLPFEAAAFVDTQIAPFMHSLAPGQMRGLIGYARAMFCPEETDLDSLADYEKLRCDIKLDDRVADTDPSRDYSPAAEAGILPDAVNVDGLLKRIDALDLETAVSDIATQLRHAGILTGDLDARRAAALGILARNHILTLDLHAEDEQDGTSVEPVETPVPEETSASEASRRAAAYPEAPAVFRTAGQPVRRVQLYIHLSEAALTDPAGPVDPTTGRRGLHLARVEGHDLPALADRVRAWCDGNAQVVVKPVIDNREATAVDAYEVPDRIKEHVRLDNPRCVFPHCRQQARRCDSDHIQEFDPDGPAGQTSTENLAPLCRRHHRHKTHDSSTGEPGSDQRRWRYRRLGPAVHLWTSPHGQQVLTHHGLTTEITPAPKP